MLHAMAYYVMPACPATAKQHSHAMLHTLTEEGRPGFRSPAHVTLLRKLLLLRFAAVKGVLPFSATKMPTQGTSSYIYAVTSLAATHAMPCYTMGFAWSFLFHAMSQGLSVNTRFHTHRHGHVMFHGQWSIEESYVATVWSWMDMPHMPYSRHAMSMLTCCYMLALHMRASTLPHAARHGL